MINKHIHSLTKSKRLQYIYAGIIIVVIAGLGTYLLIGSHAAAPYVSTAADSGTLTSGASKQPCSGSSDGNCVVFSSSSGGGGGGGTQANCLSQTNTNSPVISCGYPGSSSDPVGVSNCSALPSFSFANKPAGTYYSGTGNGLEITGNNVTISNMNFVNDTIDVAANVSNFTLNHVCMSLNGGGTAYGIVINVGAGATGMTVENSTLSGGNTTDQSVGKIIEDLGNSSTIINNYMYNFAGGVFEKGVGTQKVDNNYMYLNAKAYLSNGSEAHYEPMYYTNNPDITISHNVLLNVHQQTAEVFNNTDDGQPSDPTNAPCSSVATITNNLMAGGGAAIYNCAHSTSAGTSNIKITDNRFARCLGTPITHQYPNGGSGYTCGTTDNAGADSNGYWPYGGYYDLMWPAAYYPNNVTWSGNYWDNNLQTVNPTNTGN